MRRILVLGAAVAALGASGCASDNRAVRGAAIGGLGGAAVGAVVPGIGVGEGALIGAAGGAVVGALSDKKKGGHRWYRDDRGNDFWVDRDGRRHYD